MFGILCLCTSAYSRKDIPCLDMKSIVTFLLRKVNIIPAASDSSSGFLAGCKWCICVDGKVVKPVLIILFLCVNKIQCFAIRSYGLARVAFVDEYLEILSHACYTSFGDRLFYDVLRLTKSKLKDVTKSR